MLASRCTLSLPPVLSGTVNEEICAKIQYTDNITIPGSQCQLQVRQYTCSLSETGDALQIKRSLMSYAHVSANAHVPVYLSNHSSNLTLHT